MSFFDDDEPPTRQARPRQPAGSRTGATSGTRARTSGGGAGAGDPQQLMVRRAVALGIGALVLILLVLGIKGCLNSRTENALKDYTRNVSSIVNDSNYQVSKRLFELLNSGASGSTAELQQNVNQVRVTAEDDVKRAQALDTPGDMVAAQQRLLDTLTLRSEGVRAIAEQLPNLEGDQAEAAANKIAGQMSAFLGSDVLYSQRVVPYIYDPLKSHGIDTTGSNKLPESVFLPDTQWLDAGFVRKQLTGKGGGSTSGGAVRPGTHGHGLVGTSVGDVTLQPGGVLNRVAGAANPVFTVKFQNQGENDEFDVKVKVTITGGPKPISVQKTIDQTTHGSGDLSVQVPLGQTPPLNTPVKTTVSILPVPGETKTDNNTATYTVIFSR